MRILCYLSTHRTFAAIVCEYSTGYVLWMCICKCVIHTQFVKRMKVFFFIFSLSYVKE